MSTTFSLGTLAETLGLPLRGDPATPITGVAPLDSAGPGSLSFLANPKYREQLERTKAGAVILGPDVVYPRACLVSANPYLDFTRALRLFAPKIPLPRPGIHPQAVVDPTAVIGADAAIGPFCVVGARARIGDHAVLAAQVFVGDDSMVGPGSILYPMVTVRERVTIGARVILHPGVVLGADGFGFAPDGGHYAKIPQIGTVVLEDDVEIGANTTIDRAALGETRVAAGTKIDNLVMIAHNVTVGPDTVIAAQSGISGSAHVGSHVQLGGQVGVAGHLRINDRAIIGAQAGVSLDVPAGEFWFGTIARPKREWFRNQAYLGRLGELFKRVQHLEARLKELEGK